MIILLVQRGNMTSLSYVVAESHVLLSKEIESCRNPCNENTH